MLYEAQFTLRDFAVDKAGCQAIRQRCSAFIGGEGRVQTFEQQIWRVVEGRVPQEAVLLLPPLDQPGLPHPWHGRPLFMRQDVILAALGQTTRRHHRHNLDAVSLCLIPDALQRTPLVTFERRLHGSYFTCVDVADCLCDPVVLGIDCGAGCDSEGTPLSYIKACFGKDNVRTKLAVSAAMGRRMWGNARTEDYLRRLGAEEIDVVINDRYESTLADLILDFARFVPEKKQGPDPSLSLNALLGYPAPLFRDFSKDLIRVSTARSKGHVTYRHHDR